MFGTVGVVVVVGRGTVVVVVVVAVVFVVVVVFVVFVAFVVNVVVVVVVVVVFVTVFVGKKISGEMHIGWNGYRRIRKQ